MTETARKVVTQTSTTTGTSAGGSLIGGAACGALVEGAIGLYDIHWANEDLKTGNMSQEEYNDAVRKRIVGGVGSVTGATAEVAIVVCSGTIPIQ